MDKTMRKLKSKFLKLDKELKEYGKTECTLYRNGTCHHPAMGWGSMTTDTGCRIDNCPFILYKEVK
jgi:hypothetical protein